MSIVYRASQWHHTLNQAAGDPADPIDASHKGPIISYLCVLPPPFHTHPP